MGEPQHRTVTMRAVFDDGLGESMVNRLYRGEPWFSPDPETPSCGSVLHVPAAATNDFTERMFACDRAADHPEPKHRQVTDAARGTTLEWDQSTVEECARYR